MFVKRKISFKRNNSFKGKKITNRKNLHYILEKKKIIPVHLMEHPKWQCPIAFTWITFVNLTSVLGISFQTVMLEQEYNMKKPEF